MVGDLSAQSKLSEDPEAELRRTWYALVVLQGACSWKWSPDSKFAVECHGDLVFMPRSLIKGMACIERWTVQVKAHGGLCVADILYSM